MDRHNHHWRTSRLALMWLCAIFLTVAMLQPAGAAAPWIILIHGEALDEPVIIADWRHNAALLGEQVQASDANGDLRERPFFEIALFWGPDWREYIESGRPLNILTPDQANQHGRFYPAVGDAEARVTLSGTSFHVSRPSEDGLRALEERGVPVRLDPEASGWMDGSRGTASWLIAGVTVILAGASLIVAHKRNTRTRGWLAG